MGDRWDSFKDAFLGNREARLDAKMERQVQSAERWGKAIGNVAPTTGEVLLSPVTVPYKAAKGTVKTVGKGLKLAGWAAAIAGGIGALTWLSSRSRNDRHVDNMPPQPQEIEAAPAIPDFSTGERTVRGPFTAKVLGVGGNAAIQPNLMGGDGASLVDGKPIGALGPSPN